MTITFLNVCPEDLNVYMTQMAEVVIFSFAFPEKRPQGTFLEYPVSLQIEYSLHSIRREDISLSL